MRKRFGRKSKSGRKAGGRKRGRGKVLSRKYTMRRGGRKL